MPYYYDPLCGKDYRSTMEDIYLTTVATFLQDWHDKTMPNMDFPVVANVCDWTPRNNRTELLRCDVHRTGIRHVKVQLSFASVAITGGEFSIMHLRIMWVILTQ
ncbi:hypothetical protein F441_02103 [Phytophthora nicotianae CJ01A1]|uniref:Uncharacterized protein n=3 Tax=Phytophthora nicotianae TaxID=4792 RepID=W3A0C5_PHYNI|nr:hypothetical protein L915_21977 [Phytophthora nicotianae]ETL48414.1 hypothetical protein L916_01988 [Phytophthora nicotianae]ETM30653.1 hypothetical protein L914_21671 [Phytophthora nicotianae]ETP24984.1 hypothetical protein F441_02103 [Phytophthora nicotianae CJ01A1]ETP52988.1 hypothetical protein F442_02082 [Phytophthora nicotianae P10297]